MEMYLNGASGADLRAQSTALQVLIAVEVLKSVYNWAPGFESGVECVHVPDRYRKTPFQR